MGGDTRVTARPAGRPRYARHVWLTRLYRRFRHLVHELGKFGTVGAVAFIVDTGLLAVLLQLKVESLLAKTAATVVAATVAFLGNRFWTWRHRQRSGLTREYVLYFTFNGIGLGIFLAVLGISHYGLGRIWPGFATPLADVLSANVMAWPPPPSSASGPTAGSCSANRSPRRPPRKALFGAGCGPE